jgi:hypothetical protein
LNDADADYAGYERVTSNELQRHTSPPRRVKMLVRDFIEDSLYNPHYGYFSKQATILDTSDSGFDFASMNDSAEFHAEITNRYAAYGSDQQLWHTPAELFKVGLISFFCLVS